MITFNWYYNKEKVYATFYLEINSFKDISDPPIDFDVKSKVR
jgi:hypothetical protein